MAGGAAGRAPVAAEHHRRLFQSALARARNRPHHRGPLRPRTGHPRRAAGNRPRPLGRDEARRRRAAVRRRVRRVGSRSVYVRAGRRRVGSGGPRPRAAGHPRDRRGAPGGQVLVVSHKATLRLVLSSLLGFDPRGYRDRLDQSPACLNVVDFRDPVRVAADAVQRHVALRGPAPRRRIRRCRSGGIGRDAARAATSRVDAPVTG